LHILEKCCYFITSLAFSNFLLVNKTLTIIIFSLLSLAFGTEKPLEVLEEITVYSTGNKKSTTKSARPVNVLTGDNLPTKVGQTLGETLQNELGVTNQSFGADEQRYDSATNESTRSVKLEAGKGNFAA
jgi:hypothetical protein